MRKEIIGLFHTSTPQRSVELRMKKESKDLVASAGHLCSMCMVYTLQETALPCDGFEKTKQPFLDFHCMEQGIYR